MYWTTCRRQFTFERPLVMGILNVTPDSFSDGGEYRSIDDALSQAEKMVSDGADIIDIGGESTRPGARPVSAEVEIRRVIPVIEAVVQGFDVPVSIDTTKSEVARHSLAAGVEIVNDISGLRFDPRIADVVAASSAGLILMNSRGSVETMHKQPRVDNILSEVSSDFHRAINLAKSRGVRDEQMALDIGIGFSKTLGQNLELLNKLDTIVDEFRDFPMTVGTSRKSFIAKVLGNFPPTDRLIGSVATAIFAIMKGASILRVHDVREMADAVKIISAIRQ